MIRRPSSLRARLAAGMLLALIGVQALAACTGAGLPGPSPQEMAGTVEARAQSAAGTFQALGGTAAVAAGTLAVNALDTATALAGELEPTARAALTQAADLAATAKAAAGTALPHSTVGAADAETAIDTYANQVLGSPVSIVWAGGMTGEVARALSLPPAGTETQVRVEQVAYQTYGALLSNGAASVSYGSGAITGDIHLDIQAASLGIFSLHAASEPASDAVAMALIASTFPGIADRAYTAVNVPRGHAWTFEGQTSGIDVQTRQATQVAERIVVGVESTLRQTVVYAIVGRGELAKQVQFPGR